MNNNKKVVTFDQIVFMFSIVAALCVGTWHSLNGYERGRTKMFLTKKTLLAVDPRKDTDAHIKLPNVLAFILPIINAWNLRIFKK